MIRHASFADRSAIFNIWRICFGDSAEYINFFLNHGFEADSCLVIEKENRVVSMLHILNAEYRTFSKVFPVQYIYAAATLPAYQGRGLMPRLLEAAEKGGAANGCAFTWLLPGSGSLYNYYAKYGYKTAFYVKKAQTARDVLQKIALTNLENIKENPTNKDMYDLRQEHFYPAVMWSRREFDYALSEHKFTGGEILRFGSSYALCREINGTVEVRETTGSIGETAAVLISRYDNHNFTFIVPNYSEVPFPAETIRYGMLKPCNANSSVFEEVINSKPYVNLMLD